MKTRIIVPLHFEDFFPASCPPLQFQWECSLNILHNASWVLTDETNWVLMDFAQQHTPNDTSVITINLKQHPDEVTECKAHLLIARDCILSLLEICQKMYLYSTVILLTLRIAAVNKASLMLQYWIMSHFWQSTSSKIPAVFRGGSVGYNDLMCCLD